MLEVSEESFTSEKWSLLIPIKFQSTSQISIEKHLLICLHFRVRSPFTTTMHIFVVRNRCCTHFCWKKEMGCMVTNDTIHTWRQKKNNVVVIKCERALRVSSYKTTKWNLFLSSRLEWVQHSLLHWSLWNPCHEDRSKTYFFVQCERVFTS